MSQERAQGFTLIELMIVVAIIAAIAAIAIPNLLSARLNANESAAIATLKNVAAAQSQCQTAALIDRNHNGAGEYGGFGELSGTAVIRGDSSGMRVHPAMLSVAFGAISNSVVVRSGYHFQMWLPGGTGAGVAELSTGGYGVTPTVDPLLSETLWCCYAWPTSQGNSGQRVFFVNQSGDVLGAKNVVQRYSGPAKMPACNAAFIAGATTMVEHVATHTTAVDGERWSVVN